MKKNFIISALMVALLGMLAWSCSSDESPPRQLMDSSTGRSAPGSGKGGSMARFAISGNTLYTVEPQRLKVFDISQPQKPVHQQDIPLQIGVETIFPKDNNLFIGTQRGMYIYDISNPGRPEFLSLYEHVFSCDPVVADDNYAYVTLRSGTACRAFNTNVLQIIDITNLRMPRLARELRLTNPKGLGISNQRLFVCDDALKVFDVTNPLNLQEIHRQDINSFDVIPNNGNLITTGSNGIYQYSYVNDKLELLSQLNISTN